MTKTKELIRKYYENKHKKECLNSGLKIPQTIRGKKIRQIIKLIDDIN